MKPLALLALLAVALPARACLNDRDSDSLATQAAQLPATLRVITGRFERNPPLYYEMRVNRESAALQRDPKQFGLYDDIGVALDKLGRHDEALQTMARKRAVLPAFNPNDKANKEAWYRTFANEGTFRAHRFLKAGAPIEKLGEMKMARAQIKRAMEIKPDAHFGRERYQLMAMDWIIARKSGATTKTLGEWLAGRDGWKDVDAYNVEEKFPNRERAIEGLSGMVVLGGAWESPDMFEALADALEMPKGVTLRYLAIARMDELLQSGKPSLGGLNHKTAGDKIWKEGYGNVQVNPNNFSRLDALYLRSRADANAWNRKRQNWMTVKLETGVHPDTEPNFWSGYTETPPPSLEMEWYQNGQRHTPGGIWNASAYAGIGVALLCALVMFFGKRRKRARI